MRFAILFLALGCTDGKGPCSEGDYVDEDEDGYVVGADYCITLDLFDCDDADPTVHAGAEELCDGKDNDCDGETDDEGACTT